MKFAFIHDERHNHPSGHPIGLLCRVLGVSRAGYCAWRDREPSQRQQDNDRLLGKIKAVHSSAKGHYGAPRVHAELRGQGERCGRQRVARLASRRPEPLMRQAGLRGKGQRKYAGVERRSTRTYPKRRAGRRTATSKVTTTSEHEHPVAENLLARQFEVGAPNAVPRDDASRGPLGGLET